jgi:hypothetical protein
MDACGTRREGGGRSDCAGIWAGMGRKVHAKECDLLLQAARAARWEPHAHPRRPMLTQSPPCRPMSLVFTHAHSTIPCGDASRTRTNTGCRSLTFPSPHYPLKTVSPLPTPNTFLAFRAQPILITISRKPHPDPSPMETPPLTNPPSAIHASRPPIRKRFHPPPIHPSLPKPIGASTILASQTFYPSKLPVWIMTLIARLMSFTPTL